MSDMLENPEYCTTALGVDDAVGISDAQSGTSENRVWYLAVVKRNSEKLIREKLLQKGYEAYVATQKEEHRWANGRKKKVERVVISARIFIRLTEEERREVVHLPYINYFITDKARTANAYGVHPLAVIPDHEMQMLRFMLCNADSPVDIVSTPFRAGDRIRIVRGSLKGFEGEVTRQLGETHILIRLSILGVAITRVSPQDIELI
ncbi:MAG: UpxY family transcription antiterminator [Prevotella sp.]|nr:UpxY family transcription antiterminator [Prevotella sp.]